MSEHKLVPGNKIIQALVAIGRALGYIARKEVPVEKRTRAPAVDVAWFADDEQQYPLAIFEIESAATNSMANNPAKVYGQPAEKFERPLFFFHIILRSGSETSRIDALKGVFGTHNYRVYRLDDGMGSTLVRDILSQHRRVKKTLDIKELAATLLNEKILDIDVVATFDHAADIGFKGGYLSGFGQLAAQHSQCQKLFLRQLHEREFKQRWADTDTGYHTWLGASWAEPLHFGLLSAYSPPERSIILERFVSWQEHSSFMSLIGPHFGLSRDYDDFIIGSAGAILALAACLMVETPGALRYIAEQLLIILRKLDCSSPEIWAHCLTWTLHITATGLEAAQFEEARTFANSRGGLPPKILYSPPAFVSLECEDGWWEAVVERAEPVPMMDDFRATRAARYHFRNAPTSIAMAIQALVAQEPPLIVGEDVIHALTHCSE